MDGVGVLGAQGVAILTDPEGSVLAAGVANLITYEDVAILTDPGGSVLVDLSLVALVLTQVAILTDPGGAVLGRCSGQGVH